MTETIQQLARCLFMALAELPDDERAGALGRACGDSSALRAEVEALLAADRDAGSFLASPTGPGAAATSTTDDGVPTDPKTPQPTAPNEPLSIETTGARIGRYKLLERIGEGGMGTVWMAEQSEPVKRRVALKIVKLGMDTRQVIARFEAERQALAMMDHPHIAKVFDAGATGTGRLYFVMEYIRGIPIIEYCNQAKLDTKARLELFGSVCHAIQHAHQKGIIHRDIKPDNVLVTLHDGVPVPKVIDFGIAKATNSELTQRTLFTEHRQMIGTPAYMSPEQAEMSGLDIDTRSDIYSLGVLLYELLTGTTPFDMKALLESGFAEMMRTIREVEPRKPSTRISSLGAKANRTAQQRHVDVQKLSRLLRGDIDWIVMRCLEKDRTRRYDSANGLADDIRRHLHHEPVSAGAPSAVYRLQKFARRNRGQVLAGSAVAVALLVGIMAFAWKAKEARHQRDLAVTAKNSEVEQRLLADYARAEAERQAVRAKEQEAEARRQAAEAKKQAALAEAIARFQKEMLAAADPNKLLGDRVTVVQAMAAAVEELDRGSLADQPLVEAGVRNTIGSTLRELARYDDAEPILRKALELRRAALPPGHPGIAESLGDLSLLLKYQCNLVEAELLSREALDLSRTIFPAGHPNIGISLGRLADVQRVQNKLVEAEPLCREALAIRRAALPAGHPDIASSLSDLARVLQDQGKLAAAERHFREALNVYRSAYPAGHPEIARCLSKLAGLLFVQDRLGEAESLFREALEINRASLPAGHPDIAIGLQFLAMILHSQNKLAEAEPLYRRALEMMRVAHPAGHLNVASVLHNLARLMHSQSRVAEAELLYRRALQIHRAALPAGHPRIIASLNAFAWFMKAVKKLTDAERLYREVLDIRRAAMPAEHPAIATSLGNYASVLGDMGRFEEAELLFRESLEIYRASYPAGHPDIALLLVNLARLLQAKSMFAEGEQLVREALARSSRDRLKASTISMLKSVLGELLVKQGRLSDAEPLLLDSYCGLREYEPEIHIAFRFLIINALECLVLLYEATGRASEAAVWRCELEAERSRQSPPG